MGEVGNFSTGPLSDTFPVLLNPYTQNQVFSIVKSSNICSYYTIANEHG